MIGVAITVISNAWLLYVAVRMVNASANLPRIDATDDRVERLIKRAANALALVLTVAGVALFVYLLHEIVTDVLDVLGL